MRQENLQTTVISIPEEVETFILCTNYSLLILWEEKNHQKYIVDNHKLQKFLFSM